MVLSGTAAIFAATLAPAHIILYVRSLPHSRWLVLGMHCTVAGPFPPSCGSPKSSDSRT